MSAPETRPAAVHPLRRCFLNPYVQMMISIGLGILAQPLLKLGASETVHSGAWLGVEGLESPWVWCGIIALVVGLFSWLHALKYVPLNIAFNVSGGLNNILVPLSGWLFFHERFGFQRWLGILLVLIGVIITAKQAGAAEEKL
jgi:multidrug transporter EmrE-like cation transporter